jgi:predicted small metal-binding protein
MYKACCLECDYTVEGENFQELGQALHIHLQHEHHQVLDKIMGQAVNGYCLAQVKSTLCGRP